MPRTRKPYPPEFRQQIVELARAGRSVSDLAAKFEPSGETIRNWIKQAHLDEGARTDGLTSTEREELTRLRKENRRLQQERDILAKAAAWLVAEPSFARETGPRFPLRVHKCASGRVSHRHHVPGPDGLH